MPDLNIYLTALAPVVEVAKMGFEYAERYQERLEKSNPELAKRLLDITAERIIWWYEHVEKPLGAMIAGLAQQQNK